MAVSGAGEYRARCADCLHLRLVACRASRLNHALKAGSAPCEQTGFSSPSWQPAWQPVTPSQQNGVAQLGAWPYADALDMLLLLVQVMHCRPLWPRPTALQSRSTCGQCYVTGKLPEQASALIPLAAGGRRCVSGLHLLPAHSLRIACTGALLAQEQRMEHTS